ncbi:phage holin, partial [Staphylococcus capitis]
MKINWKNRLKNGTTLTAIIGALLLFVKQITEIFGIDISHQLEQVSGIIGTIITLLVGMGVVTNPNTKGVSDAGIDLDLNAPRNEETHPVQFKSESGAVKPEVF